MHKIFASILLLFAVTTMANAQDINKVFKNMPRDIVYGLNPELNEELLENPKDTAKFVATAIYEEIKRKAINSEFISLQTSDAGTTEIRLLPLVNDSRIVCVIQSVCGTICDSRISFYTEKWEPIDSSDLFPKKDINWFIKPDVDRSSSAYEHLLAVVTILPMKYTLSVDKATIAVSFDAKSFLSIEDYKEIESLLIKEPKIFIWDKSSFK